MFPKRVWIAFIVLLIAYAFVLQEDEGMGYLRNSSRYLKHGVHLLFFIFFFTAGYWGWLQHPQNWIIKTWTFLYVLIFVILCVTGAIEMVFWVDNPTFRNIFGGLRVFFTTPVPYALCMLLSKVNTNRATGVEI